MKKMIKKSVQLRLDELIKYVWDNDFSVNGFMVFRSDCDDFEVRVSTHMLDYVWDSTSKYSRVPRHVTFTVEVEEKITEDTEFKSALVVHHGEELELYENLSIKGLKYRWPSALQMHAVINGKLELIWECGEDE